MLIAQNYTVNPGFLHTFSSWLLPAEEKSKFYLSVYPGELILLVTFSTVCVKLNVHPWYSSIVTDLLYFSIAHWFLAVHKHVELNVHPLKFNRTYWLVLLCWLLTFSCPLNETGFPCHFFGTNQRKVDVKILSWTQCAIRIDVIGTFWRVTTREMYDKTCIDDCVLIDRSCQYLLIWLNQNSIEKGINIAHKYTDVFCKIFLFPRIERQLVSKITRIGGVMHVVM